MTHPNPLRERKSLSRHSTKAMSSATTESVISGVLPGRYRCIASRTQQPPQAHAARERFHSQRRCQPPGGVGPDFHRGKGSGCNQHLDRGAQFRPAEQREERIELIARPAGRQKQAGKAVPSQGRRQECGHAQWKVNQKVDGGVAQHPSVDSLRPRVQQHPQRVCAGAVEIEVSGVEGAVDDQRYDQQQTVH